MKFPRATHHGRYRYQFRRADEGKQSRFEASGSSIPGPQLRRAHKTLDGVVLVGEVLRLDPVLADALGISPELELLLAPPPVHLADRTSLLRGSSRWPGWGSLTALAPEVGVTGAGGHSRGICPSPLVRCLFNAPDRLAVCPSQVLALALTVLAE